MLLVRLIDLYTLVVLAAVILSWVRVSSDNPLAQLVERATEPVFATVRRVLPPMGGIDFSPFVVLVGLHLLKRLLR